jgi:hypothetical protein
MSKAFLDRIRKGGKVRTQIFRYRFWHICILHGKSYLGETKRKKKKPNRKKR